MQHEQRPSKPRVTGSSPVERAIFKALRRSLRPHATPGTRTEHITSGIPAVAYHLRGGAMIRCACCHRKLTDPVSESVGLGPVCRGKAAFGFEFDPAEECVAERRAHRRRISRGRNQRNAEAYGQLRLPLQMMLPWG